MYQDLNLCGIPLQVVRITANGLCNLVSTIHARHQLPYIATIDSRDIKYKISQALVMDSLPSIEQNFRIPSNLHAFKNTADLIRSNKFPKLTDSYLLEITPYNRYT